MKKERKKGRIKAWFQDLKRQEENVDKCFQENKKIVICYAFGIACVAILYLLLGVFITKTFL